MNTQKATLATALAAAITLLVTGCTGLTTQALNVLSVTAATTAQCPGGGSLVQSFTDLNTNGTLDGGEPVLSSNVICNGVTGSTGATGVQGTQGAGTGIQVASASLVSCPAGGTLLKTFSDINNNGTLDEGETITSSSTICNGVNGANGANGTNGASAHITVTAANSAQCAAGGEVYSTYSDGQSAVQTVICNGANGTNGSNGANGVNGANGTNGVNGTNAVFEMGAVGQAVEKKSYSACHHDYIYIPGTSTARGWLIFRHQQNGAADQGVGSTGFNVWDVDMSDFLLASEVGGVTYCSLHWDSGKRVLSYTVLDNSDGMGGTGGSIGL